MQISICIAEPRIFEDPNTALSMTSDFREILLKILYWKWNCLLCLIKWNLFYWELIMLQLAWVHQSRTEELFLIELLFNLIFIDCNFQKSFAMFMILKRVIYNRKWQIFIYLYILIKASVKVLELAVPQLESWFGGVKGWVRTPTSQKTRWTRTLNKFFKSEK